MGERRQDHRVRRRHRVHEAPRTEVRERSAAAIRRGGREHRARRRPRTGSGVIPPLPSPPPLRPEPTEIDVTSARPFFMRPSSNLSQKTFIEFQTKPHPMVPNLMFRVTPQPDHFFFF